MENDELKSYIAECNRNLSPSLPVLYEASFLKIFVKTIAYFTKYLYN